MDQYNKKSYEKYKSYLYFGILNGVLSLAMLVVTIVSTISGDSLGVQISGYAASIMWLVVAILLSRIYFAAKKADEERLDDNSTTL